jgi:hypothetical protein
MRVPLALTLRIAVQRTPLDTAASVFRYAGMVTQEIEVARNDQALLLKLPSLIQKHHGRCALMRHGEIVAILDSAREALAIGRQRFGSSGFSVQPIVKPSQIRFFQGF